MEIIPQKRTWVVCGIALRARRSEDDPLLQAVCVGFFIPILRGLLEVELVGKGLKEFGRVVLLDRKNIESVCKQVKWDGGISSKRHLAPPIAFAASCLTPNPEIETNLVGKKNVPQWTQDGEDPIFSELVLNQLRRDFADQKRIGVRVRMALLRQSDGSQTGYFNIWLQKDNQLATSESYYVRDGMTITKIRASKAKSGLFSLVLIDGGSLSNLLGDTEDPSHEDWNTSSDRSELRLWKQWKGRVKFVTNAVNGLIELLTPPITEPYFELLSDFFSIDEPVSVSRRSPKAKNVVSESDNPDIPSLLVEPKWYYFYKNPKKGLAGFRVARRQSVTMPSGFYLRVTVAYDTSKGDPFKQWSPLDFVISDGGTLKASGKKCPCFVSLTILVMSLTSIFWKKIFGLLFMGSIRSVT